MKHIQIRALCTIFCSSKVSFANSWRKYFEIIKTAYVLGKEAKEETLHLIPVAYDTDAL